MEEARPVRLDDLARCAELLGEAREEASTHKGGKRMLATSTWPLGAQPDDGATSDEALLERWAAGADLALFAGTFDGTVVGIAAGHLRDDASAAEGGPTGVIDCCYVEPGARGVGVGSALVASTLEWFVSRGCVGVNAAALPGDRATKQLYEGAGLSARLLVLHRRLKPPGAHS